MRITNTKRRIFILGLVLIMALCSMSTVFADQAGPSISFTSGGVTFNKEANLLRFNLVWNDSDSEVIDVMYTIDNNEEKKLGTYTNQDDQVIAHIYLENEETKGSVLEIYAIDEDGNESDKISSKFQIASTAGISIPDGEVPLSTAEGTWSLINLFLAALSVAMVAVSMMLFIENKSIDSFKKAGKVKSAVIAVLTIVFSIGNIAILLTTQDLKHQVVMFDNMTIAMLIITVLSIISTMILAARAYGVQSEREYIAHN